MVISILRRPSELGGHLHLPILIDEDIIRSHIPNLFSTGVE